MYSTYRVDRMAMQGDAEFRRALDRLFTPLIDITRLDRERPDHLVGQCDSNRVVRNDGTSLGTPCLLLEAPRWNLSRDWRWAIFFLEIDQQTQPSYNFFVVSLLRIFLILNCSYFTKYRVLDFNLYLKLFTIFGWLIF